MEKIFLFNVGPETEAFIVRCAGNMRIRVKSIPSGMYEETLDRIAEGEASAAEVLTPFPSGSLLLMCGLTDKHMDRLLAGLRASSLQVDYKAVLTPINGKWTLKRLMLELEREKKALRG